MTETGLLAPKTQRAMWPQDAEDLDALRFHLKKIRAALVSSEHELAMTEQINSQLRAAVYGGPVALPTELPPAPKVPLAVWLAVAAVWVWRLRS